MAKNELVIELGPNLMGFAQAVAKLVATMCGADAAALPDAFGTTDSSASTVAEKPKAKRGRPKKEAATTYGIDDVRALAAEATDTLEGGQTAVKAVVKAAKLPALVNMDDAQLQKCHAALTKAIADHNAAPEEGSPEGEEKDDFL